MYGKAQSLGLLVVLDLAFSSLHNPMATAVAAILAEDQSKFRAFSPLQPSFPEFCWP